MYSMKKFVNTLVQDIRKHVKVLSLLIVGLFFAGFVYTATLGKPEVPSKEILSRSIFLTYQDNTYDMHLKLYDPVTKKSYPVAHHDGRYSKWDWDSSGDVYSYHNPVILGDHSVAYYVLAEKQRETGKIGQPLNVEGTINIVNLKTGKTKQILRDHAGDLPQSLCCSVDPSGTKLAIPQINGKLGIYDETGNRIKEVAINARVVPQVGQRDTKNDSDLEMLSQGYPLTRWLDEQQVIIATGTSVKYSPSQDGSRDTNSLAIVNLENGQQTQLDGTVGYSIAWFDTWDNNIMFAAHGTGPDYGSGPTVGQLRLYKLNSSNIAKPQEIQGILLDSQAGFQNRGLITDRANGILYVQDNIKPGAPGFSNSPASNVLALNLQDNTRKTYNNVNFAIGRLLDSDTLASTGMNINKSVGYTDKGYLYRLSTGKSEKIN